MIKTLLQVQVPALDSITWPEAFAYSISLICITIILYAFAKYM